MVKSWDDLPLTLGVREAAAVLGYGQARVRWLCKVGRIPNVRRNFYK